MWPPPPSRADSRAEALTLLRETDLTCDAIAARLGVHPKTVHTWNARAGWPRPRQQRPRLLTGRWPAARRAALIRLLCTPGADPGDVTEILGLGRLDPAMMATAFGADLPLPPAVTGRGDPAADPATLRARLRAHIARQIAAFDAALSGAGPGARESARVLRDLGGLKRLLDTVDAEGARAAAGEGGDGTGPNAEPGTEPDLPALRAEIARRVAGFVGGRPAA
ncbi:helix-turn-helix domain-containing protein [Methylobacterium sp. NMS14P]|uniref:helix-turn-helix domain-containing protein n=1 Tax=Methylobacterium sp. NMS14P TaxID=2894310 RepID=UPI0023594A9F|nr:helix-turn-helix domain-containing protein [Methylobacterium sp. NMS14P]WCS24654.1 helix-turn-helix domain-containing protein [Methylobacterium sp. NMS14P]